MQHAEHFIRISENISNNSDIKNPVSQNINKENLDNTLKAEEN